MKTLVSFLAGCLIAAPLFAYELKANTFTLTDEEVAACEDGCVLVSRAQLLKTLLEVQRRSIQTCREDRNEAA